MAKKNWLKGATLFLIVAMAVTACSPKSSPESDFEVKPIDGGKSVEITGYIGGEWTVRIPPRIRKLPVTSIGQKVFQGNKNLTSVTIPNSVTSIGWAAFQGCSNLASITIPNGVISIEGTAFFGCASLTRVTIPKSVTSIGTMAFCDCTSLTSIIIPASVTSIGDLVFDSKSLTSVTFQGTIASGNLNVNAFSRIGDLREKYITEGIGTYTRPNGDSKTWTKK